MEKALPYIMSDIPGTRISIGPNPIRINEHVDFLRGAEGGAIDIFLGTTRRQTDGKETVLLSYEAADELAMAELSRLIEETRSRWPVLRTVVVHRTGPVSVSEISVFIGVATPHRSDSFEACRHLIDELKRRIPIWKHETFADGTSDWVEGTAPDHE